MLKHIIPSHQKYLNGSKQGEKSPEAPKREKSDEQQKTNRVSMTKMLQLDRRSLYVENNTQIPNAYNPMKLFKAGE